MKRMQYSIAASTLILAMYCHLTSGGSDKVKLEKIEVLTLQLGRMTNARRSKPIPQIQCVGGRAGCGVVQPTSVQCYNRGSDGYDVQWECKTEMDKRYKFGTIEVSCEGFDYPDDPYVLKGSCGLEYTIDYRDGGGGSSWFGGGGSSWFGGSGSNSNSNSNQHGSKKSSSGLGDLLMLIVIGLVVYAIYRYCSSPHHQYQQYSSTSDDYPGDDGHNGGYGQPPPAGFRPEFMPGMNDAGGCGRRQAGAGGGFGGFWTGAATGGLLGYLMGNNNRGGMYDRPYARDHGRGGGFFGGGSGGSGGGGSTASTSGFGGTRRR